MTVLFYGLQEGGPFGRTGRCLGSDVLRSPFFEVLPLKQAKLFRIFHDLSLQLGAFLLQVIQEIGQ